jgi:c-di-GMP-binding flagellar brake protein YcgR
LSQTEMEAQRRRWPRLSLAIPVFVRSRDENGKDFLEFATAVNISAGGALVAVRRSLPLATQVSLEIPSPPSPATSSWPKAARILRARTVRVTHAEGYHLVGLRFSRPLSSNGVGLKTGLRKVASPV